MYQLLTNKSWKSIKGESLGYSSALLFLSPHKESGIVNLCPYAKTCPNVCLNTAGRNVYAPSHQARLRRTRLLVEDRKLFLSQLRWELETFIRRSENRGMIPCFRPNGLSDLPWLGEWASKEFSEILIYDYTKIPQPWKRARENYSVVFSYDRTNERHCREVLDRGGNVAVVFSGKGKHYSLPDEWFGREVIDGDKTDLRFLDPSNVIVGLRAKGAARRENGFTVEI